MPNEEIELEDLDEEELNPFLQALADDDDDEEEESELEEEDEDESEEDDADVSPEVLKERLKQRNRTISQRTKAVKRMQKEIDELKANGSKFSPELLAQLLSGKSAEGEAGAGINLDELKERVEEDPKAMVDILMEMLMNTENKVAAVLERRDRALLSKAKAPVNPAVEKTKEALAKLEEFSTFNDEQLEAVAKRMLKTGVTRKPPAGTSSTGRKVSKGKAPTDSDLTLKYKDQLAQMGL